MSSSPATNKIAINCTDPIIIGGYPGSGTTMLILTLNQHKNIVGHKETQLIRVLRILDDYLFCQKNDTFPRYLKRYFSQEEIKRSIGVFIDDLLGKKVVVEGKRRWAEKSPHNCNFLTLWKACIPKAKFINVIRDGRDVVCSGMSYGYFKFEDGIKAWIKTIEESKKESMSLGGKNYCEIKYENIILKTESTMRALMDFIEDEWDPAILNLVRSDKFTYKWGEDADIESPIGRWKYDPEFQKNIFKNIGGEMLIDLGYEKDDNW